MESSQRQHRASADALWQHLVEMISVFGECDVDPETGITVVDPHGQIAIVAISKNELAVFVQNFGHRDTYPSEGLGTGLPTPLSDDFVELFGSQKSHEANYVLNESGLERIELDETKHRRSAH